MERAWNGDVAGPETLELFSTQIRGIGRDNKSCTGSGSLLRMGRAEFGRHITTIQANTRRQNGAHQCIEMTHDFC